jgi:hypothetical protein
MNQGNAPAAKSTTNSTTTSSQQFVEQTQTYLNDISSIRDYYASSGQQAPSGSNIPNFQTLTSELNNLLSWCRSNEQVISQIFQGQTGQTQSGQVGGNQTGQQQSGLVDGNTAYSAGNNKS